MFEVCNWGFIVNQYVPITRLGKFATFAEAQAAVKEEWARRDAKRQYTDMGTFSIRECAA